MAEYITIMLVNNKSAGECPTFHPASSDVNRVESCVSYGELTVLGDLPPEPSTDTLLQNKYRLNWKNVR